MAKFEHDDVGSNKPRLVLGVRERSDGIIVGDLFSVGPFGLLEITGGQNIAILQALDSASDHVGPEGTVFVQDPHKLWQKEWPRLT